MLSYLFRGLAYGFAAAVQPGPFQAYVISQALRRDWRRTLPVALAPLISDGPIIVVALLILNRLPDGWQSALYLVGGFFVLYLAWGAFQAWRTLDTANLPNAALTQEVAGQSAIKAALTNALSPGPYLYWGLAAGPILLGGWQAAPGHGVGFLLGFYAAMVGSMVGIILLFSKARHLGPRVNRVLVGLSAVALTSFGLYQIWLGATLVLQRGLPTG